MSAAETNLPKKTLGWPKLLAALVILAILLAGIPLLVKRLQPHQFSGMLLQSPDKAADFTLMSHDQQEVSLSDFRGKVVAIYFGYVSCPDICPVTLANLRLARNLLGEQGNDVQVLMITVDPERDTPEIMAEFIAHFDPTFIGLSGDLNQTAEIAIQYGVYFEKQETSSVLGYLVDHTATVMVIDPDGYLRLVIPFGTTGKEMAADLKYILEH
ncbi:MAG: SCO family protein [Anaerolineae bacterium]|nr:SCO family protein [Anaerolineae bacterium]